MKTYYAIIWQTFQSHVEIHVEAMKKFHTDLHLSVTTAESFFARADKQKRNIESCSGVPGTIHNFNNKNLITFEESKGDLSFALYFDFKTTAPTDNYFDPEQTKIYVVSYKLIVSFHPKLKIQKIIVERSYAHPLKELTTISYLTGDQLSFADSKLISQLRDAACEVDWRKCKSVIQKMFTIETAFVKKTLIDWFNKKFWSKYLEIDIRVKNQYERKKPIDWNKYNCVICKIPLKFDPTTHQTLNDEMSYGDFFIRYENKFFGNIYSVEELKEST